MCKESLSLYVQREFESICAKRVCVLISGVSLEIISLIWTLLFSVPLIGVWMRATLYVIPLLVHQLHQDL